MKAKSSKFLLVMTITIAMIFSLSLSGFSFGPLEFDIGIDNGEIAGYERFAVGIMAGINSGSSKSSLGYAVEFCPGPEDDGVVLSVRMISTDQNDDGKTADYFKMQFFFHESDTEDSYNMIWGSYDSESGFDETYFAYYEGDYHYETSSDGLFGQVWYYPILTYFNVLMGN